MKKLLTAFLAALALVAIAAPARAADAPTTGVVSLATCTPAPRHRCVFDTAANAWVPIGQAVGRIFVASENGITINDATDNTAALNALIAKVAARSPTGGTIFFDGIVRADGQLDIGDIQSNIRFTSDGSGGLDLRYNASVAKMILRGTGAAMNVVEMDHMVVKDGGSDCATFFRVINTVFRDHHNIYRGTAASEAACTDITVYGGDSAIDTTGATTDAGFQGYVSSSRDNQYYNCRRVAVFNGAANAIEIGPGSYVDYSCGNAATLAITAITNANPAVLTVASARFRVGDTFQTNISGFTGSWAAANGTAVQATATANNKFSIAVNSSGFGALAGSPVIPDGAMFETTGGDPALLTYGVVFLGSAYELSHYAYLAKLSGGARHSFTDVGLYDQIAGRTISYLQADASYSWGKFDPAFYVPEFRFIVGEGNASITQPFVVLGKYVCARSNPSICNDANTRLSVLADTGETAAHIQGPAAGVYVDYQGSGHNFLDGSETDIRLNDGTIIGAFSSFGLGVTGTLESSTIAGTGTRAICANAGGAIVVCP